MPTPQPLDLAAPVRAELEAIVRSSRAPAGLVRRARLIVALADGARYTDLTARWGVAATSISRWKQRFAANGVAGLTDAPRSGRPARLDQEIVGRILALTNETPPPPLTHWSVRRMAGCAGVSPSTVQRVWARAGIQPNRLTRNATRPDPSTERRAAAILGLYLRPPAHAAVFGIEERADPPEQGGQESLPTGIRLLHAALVAGGTQAERRAVARRYTSAAFVGFLDQVTAAQPRRRDIHVLCTDLPSHQTRSVRDWLAAHPRVTIGYPATFSAWLNHAELWFAKIEHDGTTQGTAASALDLSARVVHCIQLHSRACRPFCWLYR